jgi:anti-sigma-K factor RskA
MALAAAAAAVIVGAAGTTGVLVQQQRVDQQQHAAQAAAAQVAQVEAVLTAPDARIRSAPVAGGGRLSVVVSDDRDQAVMLLSGAPSPGPDRAYQMWLVAGATPVSAGVLPAGQASATRLVSGVRGMQSFAVTTEPAGGSVTPNLPPVAGVLIRD